MFLLQFRWHDTCFVTFPLAERPPRGPALGTKGKGAGQRHRPHIADVWPDPVAIYLRLQILAATHQGRPAPPGADLKSAPALPAPSRRAASSGRHIRGPVPGA